MMLNPPTVGATEVPEAPFMLDAFKDYFTGLGDGLFTRPTLTTEEESKVKSKITEDGDGPGYIDLGEVYHFGQTFQYFSQEAPSELVDPTDRFAAIFDESRDVSNNVRVGAAVELVARLFEVQKEHFQTFELAMVELGLYIGYMQPKLPNAIRLYTSVAHSGNPGTVKPKHSDAVHLLRHPKAKHLRFLRGPLEEILAGADFVKSRGVSLYQLVMWLEAMLTELWTPESLDIIRNTSDMGDALKKLQQHYRTVETESIGQTYWGALPYTGLSRVAAANGNPDSPSVSSALLSNVQAQQNEMMQNFVGMYTLLSDQWADFKLVLSGREMLAPQVYLYYLAHDMEKLMADAGYKTREELVQLYGDSTESDG